MTTPSAIAYFAGDHPAIPSTVRAQIIKRIEERTRELHLAEDWNDFCKRKGIIDGLTEALYYCEEAEKALNER